MHKRAYKRTQYIVDKGIQFRFAGLLFFYLLLFLFVSMAVDYYSGFAQLVRKLASVYPQAVLAGILNNIYLNLLIGFLIILPAAIISAIAMSHKIAGPLVRIKAALHQLIRGDYAASVVLRKHDRLKDIADLINKLAGHLKKKNV